MEIERKFLVESVPNLEEFKKQEIVQGYISFAPEIRIRKEDNNFSLTSKGDGHLTREERETQISKDIYEILFPLIRGNLIEKTRCLVPLPNNTGQLDIYHGKLNGLITIEVEFATEEQATKFDIPPWFDKEVTYDKRYKNKNLAQFVSLNFLTNKEVKLAKTK